MNILHVISSARTSGAEKHVVLLSEGLRRRGHDVLVVCPPGGWLSDRLEQADVPHLGVPMHGRTSPRSILRIYRAAKRQQADVIHTHLTRATWVGYFAAMLARLPLVTTVHILSRDMAYRHLPGRRHRYVAVAEHVRRALIAGGIRASHIDVVYNGTEFAELGAAEPGAYDGVRAELGLPADALLVGQFGRVDAFKGPHITVSAARAVVERHPNAYFMFVGFAEPQYQQELCALAERDGMAGRLRFTGVRDDVARLMEATDVVSHPSLSEACCMVLIEAMAVRRPVVATRAGGNPEVVMDGQTGLLIERNPAALASGLCSLLGDPELRADMGRAGQRRARELFTASQMACSTEKVYQRLVRPVSVSAPWSDERTSS